MINGNLPPWVEVEEALEWVEALEGSEAQEEKEADIQAEDRMELLSRINQIQGYPKTYATPCLHTGRRTLLKKCEQHGKRPSSTLEFILAKTSSWNFKQG